MFIFFHHPVRFYDLIDGKYFFNDRHDGAVGELGQRAPGELGDNFGFLRDWTGAQHRADDLLALDHHQGEVEFSLDAADYTDADHFPLVAEGFHVRTEVFGADVIEDQINPFFLGVFLDDSCEVGIFQVVDDQVCAEITDPIHF